MGNLLGIFGILLLGFLASVFIILIENLARCIKDNEDVLYVGILIFSSRYMRKKLFFE